MLRIGSAVHAPRPWAPHVALVTWCHAASMPRSPRRLHKASGCWSVEAFTPVGILEFPAARTEKERSEQWHVHRAMMHTSAHTWSTSAVKVSSFLDAPAAQRCGTMSVLTARAAAAQPQRLQQHPRAGQAMAVPHSMDCMNCSKFVSQPVDVASPRVTAVTAEPIADI